MKQATFPYESSRIFREKEYPRLPDFCEVEEKKSEIFSLPLHKNRVGELIGVKEHTLLCLQESLRKWALCCVLNRMA